MKKKLVVSLLASILSISSSLSYSEDISPKSTQVTLKNTNNLPDLPTNPPQPQYDIYGITVTSYIAGSYNYLSTSDLFTSGVPNRLFDRNENGFTLQQAAIKFAKQPKEGLGGLLNIVAGSDPNVLASYGMNPINSDSQNFGLGIWDAYLQYAINSLTVIGGRFESLPGYEYLSPLPNPNFSSSIIGYFMQPGILTGMRATYAVNDKLSVIGGVNNGWDNVRDTSRRKTIELSTAFTDPKYSIYATLYTGQERATPFTSTGPIGTRSLIDLVAQLNATENLTLVVNYDYLVQSKAALPDDIFGGALEQGIAGYVNYKFNSKWRISCRGEIFNDKDGFATGVRQTLKELTLTVGYTPLKHLELRAEARHDFSNVDSFLNKNEVTSTNNQQSFALEVIWAV